MPDRTPITQGSADPDNRGQVLMSWKFPEYPIYQRSENWFFWMGLLGGFLILYSIFTANFLFAVIVVLIALIVFAQSHLSPSAITFEISESGLKLGEGFYPWREIQDFAILYHPPEVMKIYINFKSPWRPHLSVPLDNQDPVKVRKILVKYLPENLDQHTETFSDQFSRLLKM